MAWTVRVVAQLAGITIRTLHHYDEIGLLRPSQVNAAGYRLYVTSDLERLQQILFFKELGFGLDQIRQIIDDPGFDRQEALVQHRVMLLERQERLNRLIRSVDRTLDTIERGIPLSEKELFAGFDPYAEEAKERWGQTEAYKESARRVKTYTKADWEAIKAEETAINQGLAALMDREPADPAVQEWIRRKHQHINDRFYTCSTAVFRGLGDLYVADERFAAVYEKVKPGLTAFMRAAMQIYCDMLEGK